jgi:hypothetical protein
MDVARSIEILQNQIDELRKNIKDMQSQIDMINTKPSEPKENNALILAQTNELIVASSKQVAKEVYGKIISHINTEVAPKVNSMIEYIALATEDGSESTEMYQRGVEHRSQTRNPHAGLIEMGAVSEDSHPYISPYVSLGIKGK